MASERVSAKSTVVSDDLAIILWSHSPYQFGLCFNQSTNIWNGWVFAHVGIGDWDGSVSLSAASDRDYIHDGGVRLGARSSFMSMVSNFDVAVGWHS